jgi:hypothetical protein
MAMTAEPAHNAQDAARLDLARRINELLRQAPTATVPFFGDAQQLRDFAGGKLIIEIDPAQVGDQFPVMKVINGQSVRFAEHFLGRADWSHHLEKLDRSTVYREVAELLAGDFNYRATAIYGELRKRISEGKAPVRNLLALDTDEKLDLYFDHVVEVIRSIASSGYRRRPRYNGIESAVAAMPHSSAIRPVAIELMESEIGVAVNANGSLHRIGPGTHRLAIARLLKFQRIPVEVRMFHVQWVRRAIGSTGRPLQAIFSGIRELGLPPATLAMNPIPPRRPGMNDQGETT